MEKVVAIILAAGKGTRMAAKVAKQYLEVNEKPILYYAIKAFEESKVDEIFVVVGEGEEEYCKERIIQKYEFSKVQRVLVGGKERYDSVFNGLKEIKNCDYVLIHDGARPCLTKELINETIEQVREKKACVVGVSVKDTIKVVNEEGLVVDTPDRASLMITQTPQAFEYGLICDAYTKLYTQKEKRVTDDAMVVETMLKKNVFMIPGTYENIKVTTREDLKIVEQFLENIE